jgi:hypothetical protein
MEQQPKPQNRGRGGRGGRNRGSHRKTRDYPQHTNGNDNPVPSSVSTLSTSLDWSHGYIL